MSYDIYREDMEERKIHSDLNAYKGKRHAAANCQDKCPFCLNISILQVKYVAIAISLNAPSDYIKKIHCHKCGCDFWECWTRNAEGDSQHSYWQRRGHDLIDEGFIPGLWDYEWANIVWTADLTPIADYCCTISRPPVDETRYLADIELMSAYPVYGIGKPEPIDIFADENLWATGKNKWQYQEWPYGQLRSISSRRPTRSKPDMLFYVNDGQGTALISCFCTFFY